MFRFAAVKLTILLCALLCSAAPTQQPAVQSRSQGEEPFLPFAVWYGGGKARAPMLEPDPEERRQSWREDLQKIKGLGFNSIKCWVDWASAEPAPNKFDFRHVNQLLALAEEVGLKVIVQVYIDSAPDWVGERHPDALFESNSGHKLVPQAAPGYCFDHPEVRRAVLNFFAALAQNVRAHPSFYGWDLWSEPHVVNWAGARYLTNAEYCFCPYTIARFRQHLRAKYGSLDALNRAWYRRFSSWEQVIPPRLSTILSYSDYLDWKFFILNKLAEDLKMKAEAVLREAPRGVVTSHAASPSVFTSPTSGTGTPDDWLMARVIQYWGTSLYPKHSSPQGLDVVSRAARLDASRSACYRYSDGFYVGEFQTGFGTVGLRVSATVTPADLTHWTWSTLARGAKGLNYYAFYPMSSGYESGGFGLIYLDGRLTGRSKTVGEIGKLVTRNTGLFLKARPTKAQVAVMYNPLVYMIGGPRQTSFPGAPQDEFSGIEQGSWLGIYRALFPENIPLDFVHSDDIAENGVGSYKLLYVPYPIMMGEKTAQAIVRFVEQGGYAVLEARAAWNDQRGWATPTIPGFGLDQVFGAREVSVAPVRQTALVIASKDAAVPLLDPGASLPGATYEEALETAGKAGRVVARFSAGSPAMIASSHGRGKTLYVGSYLSLAFERTRDPALGRFFRGLLDWAGIERPALVSAPDIEVRSLEGPGYALYFVFNNGDKPAAAEIGVRPPVPVTSVRDLVTGQAVAHRPAGDRITLQRNLAPQDVWVLEAR